jgi:hypothetical protein
MELIIVDKNGWSKSVSVQKAITRIGSSSANDIRLESSKIAPVHLQIIFSKKLSSNCKLTNLSSEITIRTDLDEYILPSFQTMDIRDGDEIELGDYRLIPKLPLATGYVKTASLIDATLTFPDAVLRPGYVTTGQLTIMNLGEQSDCQFNVTLSGLPEDCFYIDPIPLMFPGAQEDVKVQLIQHKNHPQAGTYDVVFTITAPEHYPGEELVIKQEIYVAPVYKHSVEIIDDLVDPIRDGEKIDRVEDTKVIDEVDDIKTIEGEEDPKVIDKVDDTEAIDGEEDTKVIPRVDDADDIKEGLAESEAEPLEVLEVFDHVPHRPEPEVENGARDSATAEEPPVRDLSSIKVVRDQFEEFWEEE